MINPKDIDITVLGCVKDCSSAIEESCYRINEFKKIFKSVRICVAENDSKDNSLELLKKYIISPDDEILTFPGLDKKIIPRTHRLGYLRNLLKEKVKTDYFIVLDFDFILKDFNNESLKSCFEFDPDKWDMLGANCNDRYYDVWTLRTKTLNYDCWDLVNHKSQEGFLTQILIPTIIAKNQIKINENVGLIPVDSCFGGLAIYKTSAFENCFYNGRPNSCECSHLNVKGKCINEVCCHVSLNKQAKAKGAKIFINSKMIVNCPKEHLK